MEEETSDLSKTCCSGTCQVSSIFQKVMRRVLSKRCYVMRLCFQMNKPMQMGGMRRRGIWRRGGGGGSEKMRAEPGQKEEGVREILCGGGGGLSQHCYLISVLHDILFNVFLEYLGRPGSPWRERRACGGGA